MTEGAEAGSAERPGDLDEFIIHAGKRSSEGLHGKRQTVEDRGNEQPLKRERQQLSCKSGIGATKGTMGTKRQKEIKPYSLSHMTLHFFAVSSWSLGLYSSGSSMSSCQYRSSALRISAIAARHVSDVTFSNPSSRWTRSPAMA